MSFDPEDYRELFPAHYSRYGSGWPEHRLIPSLKLPVVRVLGPMWSFGLAVSDLQEADKLPCADGLDADYAQELLNLYELGVPHRSGVYRQLHQPTLLSAEVQAFYFSSSRDDASRSLLAVETYDGKRKDDDSFPVSDGDPVGDQTTALLLSPFGEPQQPRSDEKRPHRYLPAMQLMQGRIHCCPGAGYLQRVRAQLGLEPAEDVERADSLYLLPDGFCVAGKIRLPWQEQPVSGWFKATYRRRGEAGGGESSVQMQRVLRPWLEAPAGDAALRRQDWQLALAGLQRGLHSMANAEQGPSWLELQTDSGLSAEDLFWPDDGRNPILFSRRQEADERRTVFLEGSGLVARLAYRPNGQRALSSLQLKPDGFSCSRVGKQLRLSAEAGDATAEQLPDRARALYNYAASEEQLSLNAADGGDLELAVPLVDSAEQLRRETGLQRPAPDAELGLLWAFTPLRHGWLHWPLPNATLGALNRLLENSGDAAEDDGDPLAARTTAVPGALSFANRSGLPGFRSGQRAWSLGLSDVRRARLEAYVSTGESWQLDSATVDLQQVSVSLDDGLLVTPWRQTPEQLLPDHAERALRSSALSAVSPDRLRGIERRMWIQAARATDEPDLSAVRLSLRLRDCRLRAAEVSDGWGLAELGGDLLLDTLIRTNSGLEQHMRPWLWLRHGQLPAVQSLPLALAGGRQKQPSGSRELAPFVRRQGAEAGALSYLYPQGLEMNRSGLHLSLSGEFQRPSQAEAWRDEIGLAVTTLPSLSLFPGLNAAPSLARLPWAEDSDSKPSWGGFARDQCYELRHDLALRDEFYAQASLPVEAAPEDGETRRPRADQALFTPRPDNGPQGAEDAATPATVWRLNWQRSNRLAALAATDDRYMVLPSSDGLRLSGLFGERDYPVNSLSIDSRVHLEQVSAGESVPANTSPQLAAIGSLHIDSAINLQLNGLPADGDLQGIHGKFQRGGGDPVHFAFGTAQLDSNAGNGFTDQRGLQQNGAVLRVADSAGAAYLLKSGQNLRNGEAFNLLTLQKPLVVASQPPLQFWAADLPLDADGGLLPAGDDPANGAAFDNNHLRGFRWSLSVAEETTKTESAGGSEKEDAEPSCIGYREMPMGLIPVDGFFFEPLTLVDIHFGDGGELIHTITLEGRLYLAAELAEDGLRLPQPDGEARLLLQRDAQGFSAQLEGDNLSWPLSDPRTAEHPSPRLRLSRLPERGESASAELDFQLGSQAHRTTLQCDRRADGALHCSTQAGELPPPGWVAATELRIELRPNDSGIMLPVRADVDYLGRFVRGESELALRFRISLFGGSETLLNDSCFHLGARVSVPIEAQTDASLPSASSSFVFDGSLAALSWKSTDNDESGASRLLGSIHINRGSGVMLAAVVAEKGAQGSDLAPRFRIVESQLRGGFELDAEVLDGSGDSAADGLRLLLGEGEDKADYRLYGDLKLRNWFRWPQLRLESVPDAPGWRSALLPDWIEGQILHRATLRLRGQSIALSTLDSGGLHLPAEVHHCLSHSNGREIRWSCYQLVRLQSLSDLRAELKSRCPPLQPKRDKRRRMPLSTFALNDTSRLRRADLQASGILFHSDAALSETLAGPLAEAVLTEPEERLPQGALAVEFSAHHLLGWRAGMTEATPGQLVTALPGIAFIGPRSTAAGSGEALFGDGDIARLFASMPLGESAVNLVQPDSQMPDKASPLPLPSQHAREAADERLQKAAQQAALQGGDVARQVLSPNGELESHANWRPLFQCFTLADTGPQGRLELAAASYPGAGVAMFLSALFSQLRAADPESYGLAQSGRLERADFFPGGRVEHEPGDEELYSGETYQLALRRFDEWAQRNLLASPDRLERAAASQTGLPADEGRLALTISLESTGQAGRRLVVIARQRRDEALSGALLDRLQRWAVRTLSRLAPWARHGVLSIHSSRAVGGQQSNVLLVSAGQLVGERPRSAAHVVRPRPVQAQRLPIQPILATASRVLPGYLPGAVSASLYGSGDAEGAEQRLTASGVATSWSLEGGEGALLADPNGEEQHQFWLSDRLRVAYRPHSRSQDETGPHSELTQALPDNYQASLPRALLPAPHGPVPSMAMEDGITLRQHLAPGRVETSRLSPRAGVWATARLGLMKSALSDDDGEPCVIQASQTPLHLRLPRPPILARNDRPRASSHESVHLALSGSPTGILHGPRVARAGAELLPTGLSREPRSRWAVVIGLRQPDDGILRAAWDGEIMLAEVSVLGTPPAAEGEPLWFVDEAVLHIDGESYRSNSVKSADAGKRGRSGLDGLSLSDFRIRGEEEGLNAQSALGGLAPASPVTLEIGLRHRGERASLRRRLRFELLASGEGLHLLETPLYFRFDDPEYNDRMDGLAKLDRRALVEAPGDEIIFAADRQDVRRSDRLELGIGLRPTNPAARLGTTFSEDAAGTLIYAGKPLLLGIARRSNRDEEEVSLVLGAEQREAYTELNGLGPSENFVAHGIDCGRLRILKDGQVPPLQLGDQLILRLAQRVENKERLVAELTFDVVEQPLLPANPSSFALLAMRSDPGFAGNAGVSVPLYASGPVAAVVELVDPRDLIDGVVRRRAIYQWRCFDNLSDASHGQQDSRFALQKINTIGASWIPTELIGQWQVSP